MQKLFNLIGSIFVAVVIAAVGYYGVNKFALLRQKEIENQARFECAESSRYQVQQSKDVTVWYPVADLYSKCLAEKGIQ